MLETVFGKFNVNDKVIVTYIPGIYALGVNGNVSIEGNIKGIREALGRKYVQILPTGKTEVLELDVLEIETLRKPTESLKAASK